MNSFAALVCLLAICIVTAEFHRLDFRDLEEHKSLSINCSVHWNQADVDCYGSTFVWISKNSSLPEDLQSIRNNVTVLLVQSPQLSGTLPPAFSTLVNLE
eukprot:PhF_6_TR36223/c0_g1_i1/m.52877